MKKYIHKLTKGGKHSYYLIIPKEIIEKYEWKEHQKLVVTDKGRGRVEIKDWKK